MTETSPVLDPVERAPHSWIYSNGEWPPFAEGALGDAGGSVEELFLDAGYGSAKEIGLIGGLSVTLRVAFGDDARWPFIIEIETGSHDEAIGEICVPNLPSLMQLIRELQLRRRPPRETDEPGEPRQRDDEEY